ncbi:spartin isoform X1 [Centruroides vittatus]|uniref:spartin isoform X1 n=1 Tax=Centruroides vittatus TaxID=120091 RepID=UPI00350EE110
MEEQLSKTTTEEEEIKLFHTNHDEAYMYISQGLSYEEQGQNILAKEMYQRGIQKMETALAIRCDQPHCTGERWNKMRNMQHKMRLTLQKVNVQVSTIGGNAVPAATSETNNSHGNKILDRPPSYEEACGYASLGSASFNGSNTCNYQKDVNGNSKDSLVDYKELSSEARMERPHSMGAEEIFSIADGVQIFFISREEYVSAPSYPSSLHIYKFVDAQEAAAQNSPQAWLQIGDWIYPLDPGKSPVLHSGYGAFIFPDVTAGTGSSIGVILPSELDQSTKDLFEAILIELTALKKEKFLSLKEIDAKERMSYKISHGIVAGAELLSEGLSKGVELTNDLMKKGASKLREKVSPESKPLDIDPRVQKGITIARNVSGTVLTVSGFLVSKLGKLTVALGHQLAPHVRKQGERAIAAVFNTDAVDSQKKMDDVMIVAAGGLKGFSTIYMGLESSARSLACCLTNETVQTVNHKYGSNASATVDNAMNAIGNMALGAYNINSLGVKAIAKKTAKDTGRAVLEDYIDATDPRSEYHRQQNGEPSNYPERSDPANKNCK